MPRIRTVKPEFWTDSKVVALSPYARLLFIGAWNFADDYGCLPADAMQLRLRVLPADQVDAEQLVSELLEAGVLEELTSADGEIFWHITNWNRHQRVSKPSDSDFGDPITWKPASTREFTEDSAEVVEVSGEISRSGKGREGKGKEGKGMELAPKTARDEVWDTLSDLFGEPSTQTNRSLRGKLVKSLSAAGADETEIRQRVQTWPAHFPDATLTETALEKHWDRLGQPPARASEEHLAEIRRLQRRKEITG